MPPGRRPYEHKKVEPPKNFRDVFRYLKELFGGFFKRLLYVVTLVWSSGKWILFLLSFIALFQGVTPIIGSLISSEVLNELQKIVASGALPASEFWSSPVFFLLIAALLLACVFLCESCLLLWLSSHLWSSVQFSSVA